MLQGFTDRIDYLNGRGVPATAVRISQPSTMDGIAFPEDMKPKVFDLLGLSGDNWTERPTDRPGVKLMQQRTAASASDKPTIYVERRDCSQSYRKPLQDAADQLRLNIECYVPHGYPHRPEGKEGTLHIYVWSTPYDSSPEPKRSAFGTSLSDGARDGTRPTSEGTVITDDDGNKLAQVLPWNIYILFDMMHVNNLQNVFSRILEKSMPYALPPEWNEQLSKMKEAAEKSRQAQEQAKRDAFVRERERYREMYVRACCGRLESALSEKKNNVRRAESQVDELSKALISTSRQAEILRAELAGLESGNAGLNDRFAKEFDQLYENKAIDRIEVSSSRIEVYTKDMKIDWEGHRYNFGQFLIRINLNGELRIYSTRHQITEDGVCVHPHVKQGSSGCLGNIASEVSKLIAHQEYVILINLIIDFLQAYNPGNPYQKIEAWR